jgi:uncharacterized membrane protein
MIAGLLILALTLISAGAPAETPVRMMYDSVFNLLFDTNNVTLILAIFTFFIGYLWLAPYIQMTEVKFYEQLRAEYEGIADEGDDSAEEETMAVD